jgi:hypothetical protein
MKLKTGSFVIGLVTFVTFSCTGNSPEGNNAPKKIGKDSLNSITSTSCNKISVNKQLNDVALFIAGLPVDSASEFFTLSQTPQWKNYQKDADIAWGKFNKVADNIRTWKNREIARTNDSIETLFYPFGGPDYLFANIFFPNAKNYILIGLENPGNAPKINMVAKDSLKNALLLYKTTIEDVIQLSFFRTVDMNQELKTQTIDGTSPLIMLFLVRSGKQIVDVTPLNLDNSGKFISVARGAKKSTAVDIAFVTPGDNTVRHIYYLSTNLADPSLSQNKAFMAFLDNIDNTSYSFVKSATYLMHKSYFSIIRNTVLKKSKMVLQDDSGIAYKFYSKTKWNIHLFGVYEKPIPLFKDFFETDLSEAYKRGATPITFRYGYNRKSNMLLAELK